MKKIAFVTLSLISFAFANEANIHNDSMRNVAVDTALQECRSSVQNAGYGSKPDMAQMDQCMSSKGFQKPKNTHAHRDREHSSGEKEIQDDISEK